MYLIRNYSYFRQYHTIYNTLKHAENITQIHNRTGCQKPCHYQIYKIVQPLVQIGQSTNKTHCEIGIWNAYTDTLTKTEVLLYPWTSLVAEFGGTLGLFLGFSFMTVWEGLQTMIILSLKLKRL